MEKTEFTFKYEGTNELDVNMVIESLQNVSNSLKEISRYENGQEIQVNVKPFKEGSYDIVFSLVSDASILGGANMFYNSLPGDGVIKKFKSILEFISLTKGKEVKATNEAGKNIYEVSNEDGTVSIVESNKGDTYFENQGAVTYIENLYLVVDKDKMIEGIKLMDKDNKEMTFVSKKDIETTSKRIKERRVKKLEVVVDMPETKIVPKNEVCISIVKPDLAGDTLWRVVFDGNEIPVKIADAEFKNSVNKGLFSFANGTVLLVDLAVTQVYDSIINVYKNKSYSVVKFHKIVDPGEQGALLFNN